MGSSFGDLSGVNEKSIYEVGQETFEDKQEMFSFPRFRRMVPFQICENENGKAHTEKELCDMGENRKNNIIQNGSRQIADRYGCGTRAGGRERINNSAPRGNERNENNRKSVFQLEYFHR
ncbi:hypothetical protein RUM44_006400 [Polyplax serrata]|uniref:Uncharacterized protein n=1 Tax=Polyplax serrata TaxID=468196 RepID=A0ABR1AI06_POLSC